MPVAGESAGLAAHLLAAANHLDAGLAGDYLAYGTGRRLDVDYAAIKAQLQTDGVGGSTVYLPIWNSSAAFNSGSGYAGSASLTFLAPVDGLLTLGVLRTSAAGGTVANSGTLRYTFAFSGMSNQVHDVSWSPGDASVFNLSADDVVSVGVSQGGIATASLSFAALGSPSGAGWTISMFGLLKFEAS